MRRARSQAGSIGEEVRVARIGLAMSRKAAARLADVSPDTQRRVEIGDPGVSVSTLCAVGHAIGLDVVLRAYPGRTLSLRDSGQLALANVIRGLAAPTWTVAIESPAGEHGEACDLVLFGATEIVDIEIDRMLVDFQAQYRRNATKRDYLAARHRRPVRLVMAVEDTVRNRTSVSEHRQLLGSALPATSREILHALRTGRPIGRDGLLWLRRRSHRAPMERPLGA